MTGSFWSAGAEADPAYAADEAEQAIRRGIELRRHNADVDALQEFEKAYALAPSPRAEAQIGLTCQALGRWAEAEEKITAALGDTNEQWIKSNHATLELSLKQIRKHLGALEIMGSPAGALVLVEGRRVGSLPLPGPVRASAGTVSLEVRADGYLPIVRNVAVSVDHLSRESVSLTPLVGSLPTAASDRRPSAADDRTAALIDQPSGSVEGEHDWHTTAAWAGGAGAVVSGAAGVVALVIRGRRSSDLEQKIGTDKTCTPIGNGFAGADRAACADLANSRDTWTAVAIATFATAAVAASGAAYFWATIPNRPRVSTQWPRLALSPGRQSSLIVGAWRF